MITLKKWSKKLKCDLCKRFREVFHLCNLYKENSIYFLSSEVYLCKKCLHKNFNKKDFSCYEILDKNFEKYYNLLDLLKLNKFGVDK